MCLVVVQYRSVPGAPILVAANREERFDRPALPPQITNTCPPVLCGIDQQGGGTWLGVNAAGLVVAVTNRVNRPVPAAPRSRGLLCRDLLARSTAYDAASLAAEELGSGRYAGANFLCLDARHGYVVHGADEPAVAELSDGLHVITNTDLDDPTDTRLNLVHDQFAGQEIVSADDFVRCARPILSVSLDADGRDVTVRQAAQMRGTVSSTIIALTEPAEVSTYLYADGTPDTHSYRDYSGLLRFLVRRSEPESNPAIDGTHSVIP